MVIPCLWRKGIRTYYRDRLLRTGIVNASTPPLEIGARTGFLVCWKPSPPREWKLSSAMKGLSSAMLHGWLNDFSTTCWSRPRVSNDHYDNLHTSSMSESVIWLFMELFYASTITPLLLQTTLRCSPNVDTILWSRVCFLPLVQGAVGLS